MTLVGKVIKPRYFVEKANAIRFYEDRKVRGYDAEILPTKATGLFEVRWSAVKAHAKAGRPVRPHARRTYVRAGTGQKVREGTRRGRHWYRDVGVTEE